MSPLPLPIAVLLVCGFMLVFVGVAAAVVTHFQRGPRCIRCGCTDDNACPGGCFWISLDPPICSRCPNTAGP